jgi:Zn-dependent metalloprotease
MMAFCDGEHPEMTQPRTTEHFIIPPYLLEQLERNAEDDERRKRFRRARELDRRHRERRAGTEPAPRPDQPEQPAEAEAGALDRAVYDAHNGTDLPGEQVRAEGEPESRDIAVNQAYDGTGATWTMYNDCFGRNSIDGSGLQLQSTVHYDRDYANAFWNGTQMVFGDGDGEIFKGFTSSIDITGHELTHGVTQYTANLDYQGQSGALNESVSDVFGSLAKQYALGQSAADADWIIGADIFAAGVNGVGLRSMKEPGTAYDDPRLGKDPQPGHMDQYVNTTDDNGGVHINSGIPNKAFYLTATQIGGNAYDDAGKIWYHALTEGNLARNADFVAFARATEDSARTLYGDGSSQLAAVTSAWQQVGVDPAGQQPPARDAELARAAAGLTPDPGRRPTSVAAANGARQDPHRTTAGNRDKGFGR